MALLLLLRRRQTDQSGLLHPQARARRRVAVSTLSADGSARCLAQMATGEGFCETACRPERYRLLDVSVLAREREEGHRNRTRPFLLFMLSNRLLELRLAQTDVTTTRSSHAWPRGEVKATDCTTAKEGRCKSLPRGAAGLAEACQRA